MNIKGPFVCDDIEFFAEFRWIGILVHLSFVGGANQSDFEFLSIGFLLSPLSNIGFISLCKANDFLWVACYFTTIPIGIDYDY